MCRSLLSSVFLKRTPAEPHVTSPTDCDSVAWARPVFPPPAGLSVYLSTPASTPASAERGRTTGRRFSRASQETRAGDGCVSVSVSSAQA